MEKNGHTKAVTSFDVAKKAGVSRASVSRAFTPDSNISPELRARIREAADELGYRVNQMARGLNRRRSDLVGLVLSNLENPYRGKQLDALSRAMLHEGLRPLLINVDPGRSEDADISMIFDYQVSGVVVTSAAPSAMFCEACADRGVPLLLIDRGERLPKVDHITGDNGAGGALVADRLVAQGRKRLVALRPRQGMYALDQRVDAFRMRAKALGVEVRALDMSGFGYGNGLTAARLLLNQFPDCDGVFCPSDITAIGCLDGLREAAVDVPGRIALVGYDDVPQASWQSIDLTTVRQDLTFLATTTIELLRSRIETPDMPSRRMHVPVSLVPRTTG